MVLTIIKYNAGNIQSVLYALERIGVSAVVTDNLEQIQASDKVIFPGVGEASTAMNYLRERKLDAVIKNLKQPVLGICLGLQLLCKHSEENNTECIGIFDEDVKLFRNDDENEAGSLEQNFNKNSTVTGARFKVPQIGWNNIYDLKTKLFSNLSDKSYCYFVHGYYASLGQHTIATTDYVQPYSSALHKNNFYGVQFHPEKSAAAGEQIIKNFLSL